ncbi:hypothetical protein ACFV4N_19530 [Actinosynnema sp. NPDC059797]
MVDSPTPPPDAPDPAVEREMLLTEYKCLRDEIIKKMDHRTAMVASSITVSSAVLGFGVERGSAPLLLVAPMVSLLLGMLIYFHNTQIGEASEYIREHIEDRLARSTGVHLGWHGTKADYKYRFKVRFASYHVPLVLIATAPAAVALPLSLNNFTPPGLVIPLVVLDTLLLLVYATQIVRNRRSV